MKKIVDWINKHKVLTICITLFLFVVQPIIVHWMFKTKAATPFWEKTWEAGDLLGYIAGFDAFIGTVFLGFIAVHQNDKANQLNSRLIEIEEKSSVFSRCPNLDIRAYDMEYKILRDVSDKSDLFYCTDEMFEKVDTDSKVWGQECFSFTFRIVNKSTSNLKYTVSSLTLLKDESTPLEKEYELLPFPSTFDHLYLIRDAEFSHSFVADKSMVDEDCFLGGSLQFIIQNNISDLFLYKVEFEILILPEPRKYKFRISDIAHSPI